MQIEKDAESCIVSNFANLTSGGCSFPIIVIRVLKLLKFSEDFIWYGKEFQAFGPRYFHFYVPNFKLFDFGISRFSLLLSCSMVRHSQFKNFFYYIRIDIVESFENFSTQTTIVANINSSFSCLLWFFVRTTALIS